MEWIKYTRVCLVFFFLVNGVDVKAEGSLNDVTIAPENNQLVLTLKSDEAITYHCMQLDDPDRLVVDLETTQLKTKLVTPDNDYLKNVRSSNHEHYLRLVFDLKHRLQYVAKLIDDNHGLKITLKPKNGLVCKSKIKKNQKQDPAEAGEEMVAVAKEELPPVNVSKNLAMTPEPIMKSSDAPKAKKIMIVIDPGHGGKDPGAAGAQGAVEKDVVLKISKHLQAMLNEEPGFTAVLTRNNDRFITLRNRLGIARKNHADLFVAVHADAYHHSHATGASVYALSSRGATSEAAHWLAEKENESELGGLGTELADKDALLRSVLIDLSQTHTIESSLQIGHSVLNNLGKLGRLHHPRVEQAAFVVLKSPDIPSILVETGFLSNALEEEKLTNSDYQYRTALAVKEGIKQYFKNNSR